jgi:hypothetical protein
MDTTLHTELYFASFNAEVEGEDYSAACDQRRELELTIEAAHSNVQGASNFGDMYSVCGDTYECTVDCSIRTTSLDEAKHIAQAITEYVERALGMSIHFNEEACSLITR